MTTAIFGRDDWMSRLRDDVDRTVASHGGLVLVSGEAGIGKTTLIGSAVEYARARGAVAAVGTCHSSQGTPPLWPWVQVFRALQRALGPSAFGTYSADTGLDPADLADFTDREGGFKLGFFDSVAAMLASISHEHPLIVAIEDLHWADTTSVQLLDFLSRQTWFERILLVGTYRDTEIGVTEEAHRVLSALTPQAGTIQLAGLDLGAVEALVHRVSGQQPPSAFVDRLHHRTGGNPFFVEQTARLWVGGHGDHALAPGVTEAVRRRLRPLSEATLTTLQAAAVVGNAVTLRVLAAVTGQSVGDCSGAVAAALSARLLRISDDGDHYEFVHDLVRETVLADLEPAREARLHAAIVDALDDHPDAVLPGQAADHAVRAGDLVDSEKTVDLLVAAGRDANSRLDLPSSINAYRRAAALTPDPDRRTLIRFDLGSELYFQARLRRQPRDEAVAMLHEVIEEAYARSAVTAARVAIGLRSYTAVDRDRVDALLRASAAKLLPAPLPDSDDELVAAVVEHLAELARADSDHDALSAMLTVHHATLWRPGTAPERHRVMTELQTVARRSGDRNVEQFATSMLWVTLLEQNDVGYLEQYRAFAALAARYQSPVFAASEHIDGALIAGFRGRFSEAWKHYESAASAISPDHAFAWSTHYLRWSLQLRQGALHESRQALERLASGNLNRDLLLAVQAAEERRFADAAGLLERVPDHEPNAVPQIIHDRTLAIVAAGTRDPHLIDRARDRLRDLSGTWSVDLYGMDLGGPVDLYLGSVEAAAGERRRAIQLLERAVHDAEHLSSPYWAATAQLALLDALGPSDERTPTARDKLTALLADLDVPHLQRRAHAMLDEAPTEPPAASPVRHDGEFRRQGARWYLGLDGTTVTLPHAKGLADLHTLLSSPGTEIACTDLLNPHADAEVDAATRFSGDPVLDDTARERYRARLASLDELLDAAGLAGDTGRRDALLLERTALIDELRAATSIGGRPRRLGDQSERVRKTVTARVRDSLRKIEELHPALGEHLRATVSTGTFCCYRPAADAAITWQLH